MGHDQSKNPLDHMKKKSLYIFAALLALSAGYLLSAGESPTGAVVGVADAEAGGLSISAKLAPPLPELDVDDVTLTLKLLDGGELSIDGLVFSGVRGTLILTGYSGMVSATDRGVTLKGKAASAVLDSMGINKNGNSVAVTTTGVPFVTFNVAQVSLDSLELVSTGTVDVDGKGSFLVNNELVQFSPFSGTIDIDPRGLILAGHSDYFNVKGERTVSVE
jgi:hypothetical protein